MAQTISNIFDWNQSTTFPAVFDEGIWNLQPSSDMHWTYA